jgi:hypothetical protein
MAVKIRIIGLSNPPLLIILQNFILINEQRTANGIQPGKIVLVLHRNKNTSGDDLFF